jgi:hypothetical protein
MDALSAVRDGEDQTGPENLGAVTFGAIASTGGGVSGGRQLMTRFAGPRRPGYVAPNRDKGRGIDELRAVASDVSTTSTIPSGTRAALDRAPRKCHLSHAVQMTMLTHRARHDVAIGARDRSRHRRRRMGRVGSAFRPSIVTTSVTRSARAAAVAEVDASVQVERTRYELRAGGICLEVTEIARAGIMRGGRSPVTVAATHCDGIVPGRARARSAAIVTRNGTNACPSIVARMGPDRAIVENDFDAAVAVQPTHDVIVARYRMAG